MKWVTRIIQGLLVIDFLLSGIMKLTGNNMVVQEFTKVYNFSLGFMYTIGILEVLGALGLFIGYWKPKLAIAASGGLGLIMIGAVFTLFNAGQGLMALMPLVVLILSIIVFIRNQAILKKKSIIKEG
ncbi:DoxX family protein [Priestia megaterium]|jgi:putative oxidoreductase|uniref:DoxX family protein n=1 Tax=Priestia megaterium TaxID=1404 RepID=UPI0008E53BC8|nr:DoxX-like family protein [Priestia megaterium]